MSEEDGRKLFAEILRDKANQIERGDDIHAYVAFCTKRPDGSYGLDCHDFGDVSIKDALVFYILKHNMFIFFRTMNVYYPKLQ